MLWHGPHHLIRELGKELSHINTATLPSWLQGIENWATSLGGGHGAMFLLPQLTENLEGQ